MPKFVITDPVYREKDAPGVRWPGRILVLARRGQKELWKVPGCSISYSSIIRKEYIPGEVILVDGADARHRAYRGSALTISDNGRVSKALFLRQAEVINEFFGCELADKLDPKKTIIVEDS